MRSKPSLFLSLLVMLFAAWAVWAARSWPWKAALFPLVIGIPLFCLAAGEFLLGLFGAPVEGQSRGPDFQLSAHLPEAVAARRTLTVSAWILGFFLGILLIGFGLAVPLFVFLYLTVQGRERLALSIGLALIAWGFFHGLFIRLLHIPFQPGWIQTWIGIQ